MSKRKSYTADFKLNAIKYAEEHGNRKAGKEFNVDEKSIRSWREHKILLTGIDPNKRACRGLPPRWPQLEAELNNWLIDELELDHKVTNAAIREKAKEIAAQLHFDDFKGSSIWISQFMKRNNFK